MPPLRFATVGRLARLMCWVMLLLPLMQTAAVAHELGHLNGGTFAEVAIDLQNDSSLLRNGFCDACLSFATITGGIAATPTERAALPPQHSACWQPTPFAYFGVRNVPAYASRAPPFFLA